jgi:catechol 2,3-dioxygenase-like lactoylglutathione lyase family enzyme
MIKHLAHIALLVDDYDKAINYYTKILNFILLEDTPLSEDKRWVLIAPSIEAQTKILLAKASNEKQVDSIGKQAGGRVFLFLYTDNFERDYEQLELKLVKIIRLPVIEKWGKVLVFEDLYGNWWDLIEPSNK